MKELMQLLVDNPHLGFDFKFRAEKPKELNNVFILTVEDYNSGAILRKEWTLEFHNYVINPYEILVEKIIKNLRQEGFIK